MKFKLPRQVYSEEIRGIVSREARRLKVRTPVAQQELLKQLSGVNRAIVKGGLPRHLVCKKLPGKLGYGIFLHPGAEPILRGQAIAPYAGELCFVPRNVTDDSPYAFELIDKLLLTQEEQARFDKKNRYHPRRYYSLQADALKRGNFTRFINHSDAPNVIAGMYQILPNSLGVGESPLEVIYFAKKKIHPGEQLLICYEGDDKSYWGALQIKPLPVFPKTFKLNSFLKVVGFI